MPRTNVWIRKEDEEKWNDIPNKSEFVHTALNGDMEWYEKFIKEYSSRMVGIPHDSTVYEVAKKVAGNNE